MLRTKHFAKRGTAVALGCLIIFATLLTAMFFDKAKAGMPTSRKIFIASSAASATDVTYSVSFVTATTNNVQGLVIDFCSNSPIIGDDTCTAPAGFDTNEGGLALANQVGITDWAVNAATTTNKLVLNRPSATSINSGVTISLDLGSSGGADGVTNPSTTNATYYARVLTFATTAGATGYTSATPGTYVDAGGIALSTANQLAILAIVQERLTFCVYTGANCGAGGGSINLGDANYVLDTSHSYTDINAKFDIATNALAGANVVLKGATLTSGGYTITAIGAASAASSTGTEQFGMCLWQSSGSGFTPAAPYNHASCSTVTTGMDLAGAAQFAFDSAVTGTAVGDDIGTKTAGTTSQATLAFLGNIAWQTESGVYQTTLTLVATGTY
jgi:hypothetical protein